MPKNVPAKIPLNYAVRARLLPIWLWINRQADRFGLWVSQHWFRLLIIALLTFILLRKDVSLQLNLQNGSVPYDAEKVSQIVSSAPEEEAVNVITVPPILSAKREKQVAYVQRFAEVAQQEMTQFGIPASITLGQGLLETNAGESPLATENNNHFGLKCFSRSCGKGHCSNFSDDSHKDFFRKYATAWESFRAHSLLLKNSDRYQALFTLPKTDYKAWASGLSAAGYATDKQYSEKLVRLIEELGLDGYDG